MDPAIARSSALPASFQAQQADRAGARAREDAATFPDQAGFQPNLTDSATFTPAAIAAADQAIAGRDRKGNPAKLADQEEGSDDGGSDDGSDGEKTTSAGTTLTADEQQMVVELASRDREVRAHEAAHQAAGGALAKGASFSYQQGPDGKSYAIGGEVQIDMSSGGSPQATITRMQQVRQAALAPAQPSSQDRSVAAAASQAEAAARQQLAAEAAKPAQANDKTTEGDLDRKAGDDGAATTAPRKKQAVEAYQQAGASKSLADPSALALIA